MTYKESFIKFMVDSGVLKFGEFTLKSGRLAPYFINAGNYKTGAQLAKLGEFYAECIMENGLKPQTLSVRLTRESRFPFPRAQRSTTSTALT